MPYHYKLMTACPVYVNLQPSQAGERLQLCGRARQFTTEWQDFCIWSNTLDSGCRSPADQADVCDPSLEEHDGGQETTPAGPDCSPSMCLDIPGSASSTSSDGAEGPVHPILDGQQQGHCLLPQVTELAGTKAGHPVSWQEAWSKSFDAGRKPTHSKIESKCECHGASQTCCSLLTPSSTVQPLQIPY